MNLDLVATFKGVAVDLLATFGRPATHTNSDGDEATVQAVIEQTTDALTLADGGPWPQVDWTVQVATADNVTRGDTLAHAGTPTADDPIPDDVVWIVGDVLNDDGFVRTLAIRREP